MRASLEIVIDRRERIDCQDRRQAGPERVVIGIEGNRTSVTGESLIQLPQALERKPKVTVRLGVIGFEGKGFRDEINGGVVFSHI